MARQSKTSRDPAAQTQSDGSANQKTAAKRAAPTDAQLAEETAAAEAVTAATDANDEGSAAADAVGFLRDFDHRGCTIWWLLTRTAAGQSTLAPFIQGPGRG